MGKKWIRLWVEETFHGTTFQELNATERGIWFSLLIMAGLGQNEGKVELRNGIPYPKKVLATLISVPKNTLLRTLNKLEQVQKITLNGDGIITITNWDKYQTRYEKYYKGRKNDGIDMPPKSMAEGCQVEGEGEVEENIDETKVSSSPVLLSPKENEQVREIFAAIKERRGWNSSKHSAEAKAIRQMLRENYTVEEILACYDNLKQQAFWHDKPLMMMSVQRQIGEWRKNRQPKQDTAWRMR